MKLFYDARYIRTDFHDGISRFSTEVGNSLAKITDVTFIIFDPAQIQFLPPKAKYIKIHSPTSPREPWTARVLNKLEPDVVFSPMQTMGSIGRKYKLILSTHDMIYYKYPQPPSNVNALIGVGWRLYHATYILERLVLNGADMVATVSHTMRRELEQAHLTKRPIIVVPNAPQQFHTYPVGHKGKIQNIVYMGSFMPYKNVETIIKGMKWLPGRTLHLLSKITPARRKEYEAIIPKGADVRFHGGTTNDTYEALLANNAVLAMPSFDEGFGLPVAEAIAMGVPAVISNIPIFHEVAAGGALYFDPHKPKAFADQVIALDKKELRDDIIKAGKRHISTFNWDDSARTLLNAVKSLV